MEKQAHSSERFSVDESRTDFGGQTSEGPAPDKPLQDPAALITYRVVQRAIDREPGLSAAARRSGTAIVVQVPDQQWVEGVAEAWRELVFQTEDVPEDGNDTTTLHLLQEKARWVEFRATERRDLPHHVNKVVQQALALGRTVIGFAPDPEQSLPRDLVRAADLRVTIVSPSGEDIAAVIGQITGQALAAPFPEDLVPGFQIEDLCLAYRPDEGTDALIARLRALQSTSSRWSRYAAPKLDSLAGMDAAVAWGRQLAEDLQQFRAGSLPWNAVDRGVLLFGPPGTGKTIFAAALAASCDLPLVASSVAGWQSAGNLGETLAAMRRSFRAARQQVPCILFIDEIDAIGSRSELADYHRTYSTQFISGLLEELDGTANRDGIVVVAACNYPHRLDPAILRSGRLDRSIEVPLPDVPALIRIFRFHLGPELPDDDLTAVATLALGGTGADCERWVRGARRRARADRRPLTAEDIRAEILGVSSSPDPYRDAVHEAGHALVTVLLQPRGTLLNVTLDADEYRGGTTRTTHLTQRAQRADMATVLCQFLAGRAAEEVELGAPSAGAGGTADSDLAKATALAVAMVGSFGLDGPLVWRGPPNVDAAAKLLAGDPILKKRVEHLMSQGYARAIELLSQRRAMLRRIASELLERRALSGSGVEHLVNQEKDAELNRQKRLRRIRANSSRARFAGSGKKSNSS